METHILFYMHKILQENVLYNLGEYCSIREAAMLFFHNLSESRLSMSTTRSCIEIYVPSANQKKLHSFNLCTVSQRKKKKHPYLFQYKLSYRNETGTNHHDNCPFQFDDLKFS